jgi:hypothetical protein
MKYEVWTYFKGSKDDAQEIVNDWNEITKTKSFRFDQSPSGLDTGDLWYTEWEGDDAQYEELPNGSVVELTSN